MTHKGKTARAAARLWQSFSLFASTQHQDHTAVHRTSLTLRGSREARPSSSERGGPPWFPIGRTLCLSRCNQWARRAGAGQGRRRRAAGRAGGGAARIGRRAAAWMDGAGLRCEERDGGGRGSGVEVGRAVGSMRVQIELALRWMGANAAVR